MAGRAAVFVGIDRYWIGNWQTLKYAESDCRKLAQAFQAHPYEFKPEAVRVWTASDTNPRRQPVRNRLLYDSLLPDGAQTNPDLFVFFFAGHGVEEDEVPYLIPADGVPGRIPESCIRLSSLMERIAEIPARHRLLIFDTCFETLDGVATRGAKPGLPASFKREAEKVTSAVVLTSCDVGEQSYEADELQGGLFTHYWWSAMQECVKNSQDGRVTVFDIEKYVAEHLREWVDVRGLRRQEPRIWAANTPIFYLAPADLPEEYPALPSQYADPVSRTENIVRVLQRVLAELDRSFTDDYTVRICARLSAFAISEEEPRDAIHPNLRDLYLHERDLLMQLLEAGSKIRLIVTWHTLNYSVMPQRPPVERFEYRLKKLREFCEWLAGEKELVHRFTVVRLPLSERNLLLLGNEYFFEGRKLHLGHGFDATRLITDARSIRQEIEAFDGLFESGVRSVCEEWRLPKGRDRNGRLLELLIQHIDEELQNLRTSAAPAG